MPITQRKQLHSAITSSAAATVDANEICSRSVALTNIARWANSARALLALRCDARSSACRDTPARRGRAPARSARLKPRLGRSCRRASVRTKGGAFVDDWVFKLSQMWTKNDPGPAAQRQGARDYAVPGLRRSRPAEIRKHRRLDQRLAAAAGVIFPAHISA
jgi:hypothetical protein